MNATMKYSNMVKRSSTTDHPFKQPFPIRPCCAIFTCKSPRNTRSTRVENRTNDRTSHHRARRFVKYLSLIIEPMAIGWYTGLRRPSKSTRLAALLFLVRGDRRTQKCMNRDQWRGTENASALSLPSETLGERNGETIGETFRNADKL